MKKFWNSLDKGKEPILEGTIGDNMTKEEVFKRGYEKKIAEFLNSGSLSKSADEQRKPTSDTDILYYLNGAIINAFGDGINEKIVPNLEAYQQKARQMAASTGMILTKLQEKVLAAELYEMEEAPKVQSFDIEFAPRKITSGTKELRPKESLKYGKKGFGGLQELLISDENLGIKTNPFWDLIAEGGCVTWKSFIRGITPAVEIDEDVAKKLKKLSEKRPELFEFDSKQVYSALMEKLKTAQLDENLKKSLHVFNNDMSEIEDTPFPWSNTVKLIVNTDLDGVTRFEFDKTMLDSWSFERLSVLHYGRGGDLRNIFENFLNPLLDQMIAPEIKDIFRESQQAGGERS